MDTSRSSPSEHSIPCTYVLRDGRTCTIRRTQEKDAGQLCSVLPLTHAESDFLLYIPGEFRLSVEEERSYLREHGAEHGSLHLCADLDDRLIAFGGAERLKCRRHSHTALVGLTVVREYWRQGLGRKMMHCIMHWAKQEGLRRLNLRVYDHNVGAIALYRALDFVEEGRLIGDVLRADGTYSDTILMGKHFADAHGDEGRGA